MPTRPVHQGCWRSQAITDSASSNSCSEYFEIAQNLSLTQVIFPCGSVMATMACSSSAAFKSSISLSDALNCCSGCMCRRI